MFSCENSYVYTLGISFLGWLVFGCFLYRSGPALYAPCMLGGFLTLFFLCINILACLCLSKIKIK